MTYVIVGAGEAGLHAALAMRANGYEDELVIIGQERHSPYTRPPLSKAVLTAPEPTFPAIRPLSELSTKRITMRLGTRVTSIDRSRRVLACSDGSEIVYAKLVLATGAQPRPLQIPGIDCTAFKYLRSFDDALDLRESLQPGCRVALVGGGYIGMEIAASAVQRGCYVTVIEAASSIMSRVMAPEVAAFFRELHESHGVEIRTSAHLKSIANKDEGYEVACATGDAIHADVLLAGVGVTPCSELAERAGLLTQDGIVVDEYGQTSDPDIFACGDVANHPNSMLGRRLRLESWQNAQQQATVVGAAIAGVRKPYALIPWFWSDQYDVNLQLVGCPCAWDDVLIRGDVAAKSFTAFYLDTGVVVAANAINRPKDIAPTRRAIEKQVKPRRESLADVSQPLANAFTEAHRRIQDAA